MSIIGSSMRAEWRRLVRTRLLGGLLLTFAFFGASAPALARSMPALVGSATGSEQITIEVRDAVPDDALALFNQSALQLGVVFAVAAAVTGLGWDTRTGSSIFYRVRARRLGAITLPRLGVTWLAATGAYIIGLALTVALTGVYIGALPAGETARVGVASVIYIALAMALGHSVMAAWRRVAPTLAVTIAAVLLVPIVVQASGADRWSPTALTAAQQLSSRDLVAPGLVALASIGVLLAASVAATATRSLRRDA